MTPKRAGRNSAAADPAEKSASTVLAAAQLDDARDTLRRSGRDALGIGGDGDQMSMRQGFRLSEAGPYTLLALGLLLVVDGFLAVGFQLLGPDVGRSLGISQGGITGLLLLGALASVLATLPIAALVQKRARRALVALVTAVVWSAMTLGAGFATSIWALAAVLTADGASSGSVAAVHQPLIMDRYTPTIRIRAVSYYRIAGVAAAVLSPLLVTLLTGPLHLTWRGVFVAMGVACLGATLVAVRLRDPGFGRFDAQRIREKVRSSAGGAEAVEDEEVATQLGFFEVMRRILLIRTFRLSLVSHAVFGMLLVPLSTYIVFFLERRYGLGAAQRGIFFSGVNAVGVVSILGFSHLADGIYRRDPARLLKINALLHVFAMSLLPVAVIVPRFWMMAVAFGVATGIFSAVSPAVSTAILSTVQPRMRPHAAAMTGIFSLAVGGGAGLVLLSGADQRYGTTVAIGLLVVPGVVSALVLMAASRTINGDLDHVIDEVVEEEELNVMRAQGVRLPMLACRKVNFSYGQLQVLFDVDFAVDDGEMVALLGTNGAGKSTLLKVVSGIGLPSSGTVRFRGTDITYLDAERRLGLGITQVPGGRAVFNGLTVVENLRLFGHTVRREGRRLDTAMDECFAAFPRLGERRNQKAGSLSGGEQQMLGLAKALILKPQLLLIDELSLGLAPVIVGQLLEMVKQINQDGTAVVLVEQSVNIALSLVDHAYFMEKGEIRFDGPARELLERGDLVRAVFLQGAAAR